LLQRNERPKFAKEKMQQCFEVGEQPKNTKEKKMVGLYLRVEGIDSNAFLTW
jgi:hypothetical protein